MVIIVKQKTPKHTYKKAGEYETKLWATNNYDTGKPPVSRPKKVKIEKDATAYNEEASMTEGFTLQRNREPNARRRHCSNYEL